MRRYLGISGLVLLAGGLLFGITGPVAGEVFGQTGYGDETVRGFALSEDEEPVIVDGTEDGELDEEVAPGTALHFTADGFMTNSNVIIEFHSEVTTLLFTKADDEGKVDVIVRVPEGATEGDHKLVAVGTDPNGDPHEVSVDIVVDDNPGESTSWVTAGSVGMIVGMLLVLAVVWRVVTRRKAEEHII